MCGSRDRASQQELVPIDQGRLDRHVKRHHVSGPFASESRRSTSAAVAVAASVVEAASSSSIGRDVAILGKGYATIGGAAQTTKTRSTIVIIIVKGQ